MRSALFAIDCLIRPTTAQVLAHLRATRDADQAHRLADALRKAGLR